MLVISRKVKESITCTVQTLAGPIDIVIHCMEQSGSRMKLGIECPDEVKILRTELIAKQLASSDRPAPLEESGSTDRDEDRGHSDAQEPAK